MDLQKLKRHPWQVLAAALAADLVLPFLLALFDPRYSHQTMLVSELGSAASPVRWIYRLWVVALAAIIIWCAQAGYRSLARVNHSVAKSMRVMLVVFGITTGLTGIFSNDMERPGSVGTTINNLAFNVAYMSMLVIIAFAIVLASTQGWGREVTLYAACFMLSIVMFVLFLMSTPGGGPWLVGVWSRLNAVFSYLPLIIFGVRHLRQAAYMKAAPQTAR